MTKLHGAREHKPTDLEEWELYQATYLQCTDGANKHYFVAVFKHGAHGYRVATAWGSIAMSSVAGEKWIAKDWDSSDAPRVKSYAAAIVANRTNNKNYVRKYTANISDTRERWRSHFREHHVDADEALKRNHPDWWIKLWNQSVKGETRGAFIEEMEGWREKAVEKWGKKAKSPSAVRGHKPVKGKIDEPINLGGKKKGRFNKVRRSKQASD